MPDINQVIEVVELYGNDRVANETAALTSQVRQLESDLSEARRLYTLAVEEYATHMSEAHPPPAPEFDLVYENDFLNQSSLREDFAVMHGIKQFVNQGARLSSNVEVGEDSDGGFLEIHTRPVTQKTTIGTVTLNPGEYTAGGVTLRPPHQFTYGAYEFDVEIPVSNGTRTVALLWPESDEWIEGEVDFLEIAGSVPYRDNNLIALWHSENGQMVRPPYQKSVEADFTKRHHLRLEWTPGRLKEYLDGILVWDHTKNIPNTPFKLALQTAVGGGGRGTVRTQPGKMRIRNLKVYRYILPT